MSYYDDYDDDEYSSEDEIFYHNYSVDYANQLLGGHHAISSCLPLTRRKFRRHSPRLVRVATLDQMPIVNRHSVLPLLRSRPKYGNDENFSSPLPAVPPPPPLPSLEATTQELERRATRTTQPAFQVNMIYFKKKILSNFSSMTFSRKYQEILPHFLLVIIQRLKIPVDQ